MKECAIVNQFPEGEEEATCNTEILQGDVCTQCDFRCIQGCV